MDYIYYTGDYVTYEGSLTGENMSYADSLQQTVTETTNQIQFINDQLTEWKGDSKDSNEALVRQMITQFNDVGKQIGLYVKPACEAADKLKGELEKFKKADKEAAAAKKAWKALGETEPSKTKTVNEYNEKTKKYESKEEHNEAYDTWHEAKDDYEGKLKIDEAAKTVCDGLISTIKSLELALTTYSNLLTTSSDSGIIDLSAIKDFSDMTYEEKKAFIDSLVENYKALYDELEKYYNEHFSNGCPVPEEDLINMIGLFQSFNLIKAAGVTGGIQDDSLIDILKNPDSLGKVIKYCNDIDFFGKLKAYADGASWEDSGLADVIVGVFEGQEYDERVVMYNLSGRDLRFSGLSDDDDYYCYLAFRGEGDERPSDEDVSSFLRSFINKNYDRYVASYVDAVTVYNDYATTVQAMASTKELYLQARRSQYLLPCVEHMNDEEFAEFLKEYEANPSAFGGSINIDEVLGMDVYEELFDLVASTPGEHTEAKEYLMSLGYSESSAEYYIKHIYNGIEGLEEPLYSGMVKYDGTYADYMTDEEKALYYYLQKTDPALADQYKSGMHNELNQRYAKEVATAFINDNGYKNDFELMWAALTDGGSDGVENFVHGCKNWFELDENDVLLGDHTLAEYVGQYKTQYLLGNLDKANLTEQEKIKLIDKINECYGDSRGTFAKEFYSTGQTVGYMAIPMTLALATQGVGGALSVSSGGTFLSGMIGASTTANVGASALLGWSAGGNNMDNALSAGASLETAYGYGVATWITETLTEAGTSEIFGFGGLMPGLKYSANAAMDILGEGCQEVFQTGCENLLYNAFYDAGAFDNMVADRVDLDEGMLESFWEAIKASGVVRGAPAALNFATNPDPNTLVSLFYKGSGTDTNTDIIVPGSGTGTFDGGTKTGPFGGPNSGIDVKVTPGSSSIVNADIQTATNILNEVKNGTISYDQAKSMIMEEFGTTDGSIGHQALSNLSNMKKGNGAAIAFDGQLAENASVQNANTQQNAQTVADTKTAAQTQIEQQEANAKAADQRARSEAEAAAQAQTDQANARAAYEAAEQNYQATQDKATQLDQELTDLHDNGGTQADYDAKLSEIEQNNQAAEVAAQEYADAASNYYGTGNQNQSVTPAQNETTALSVPGNNEVATTQNQNQGVAPSQDQSVEITPAQEADIVIDPMNDPRARILNPGESASTEITVGQNGDITTEVDTEFDSGDIAAQNPGNEIIVPEEHNIITGEDPNAIIPANENTIIDQDPNTIIPANENTIINQDPNTIIPANENPIVDQNPNNEIIIPEDKDIIVSQDEDVVVDQNQDQDIVVDEDTHVPFIAHPYVRKTHTDDEIPTPIDVNVPTTPPTVAPTIPGPNPNPDPNPDPTPNPDPDPTPGGDPVVTIPLTTPVTIPPTVPVDDIYVDPTMIPSLDPSYRTISYGGSGNAPHTGLDVQGESNSGPNLAGIAAVGLAAGLGGIAGTMLSKEKDKDEEDEEEEKESHYYERIDDGEKEKEKSEAEALYEKMILNKQNQSSNENDDNINADGLL